MIVKLLTEHHLEFLSLTGRYTDSSESTLVKMPHCWKSHAMAQFNWHYDGGKIMAGHLILAGSFVIFEGVHTSFP